MLEKEGGSIDYVLNSQIAIRVAEALWPPLYGECIYEHQPFSAELQNEIWLISGKPKSKKGDILMLRYRRKIARS